MSYKLKTDGGICIMPSDWRFPGLIRPFILLIVITIFLAGCEKNQDQGSPDSDPMKTAGINEVIPANLSDSIEVDPVISVIFKPETEPSKLSETTLTLTKGNSPVPGRTTITATKALFTPDSDLSPEAEYTATVKTGHKGDSHDSEKHEYTWKFKTGKHHRKGSLSVVSTDPSDKATAVPVSGFITVTFNQELTTLQRTLISISLKNGTSSIEGSLAFSGKTATFKPKVKLSPNTVYSGRVKMGSGYHEDDKSGDNYSWSFTTGAEGNDITAPSVSSVVPANNATSVTTSASVKVTFSEAMNLTTINAAAFTLKQGTTGVDGSVSYSGVTATFTPASALAANTVYTGTVTTSVKDAAGNALAANYSWSFTTASATDVTAPTVLSVTPLLNATSVAVNSKATVTFSEAMNSSTISSSTFTLKQGTTDIAGTVSYSSTTATFTPSSALAGNTVYTGTITTGAKDASGNALAANYSWSFTTVATSVLLSFATDVVPVLNLCNNCHTHPWTTSSVASTFYTNLVNAGYVKPSSPTTSTIYTKLSGGHPGSSMKTTDINKILNWMTEGSNNN